MNEIKKEINVKYNQFIEKELRRLEKEMEIKILKFIQAFGKSQF
jgi:hypothetical protein